MVKAIRWIRGRENGTAYSFQELVDFVDQEKGKYVKEGGHFCYTLSIIKALTYIVKKGIQREVDRPFVGCRAVPPPRVILNSELGFIGAVKKIPTIEEALVHLQTQPLGAAFPIFLPDYEQIRGVRTYMHDLLFLYRTINISFAHLFYVFMGIKIFL